MVSCGQSQRTLAGKSYWVTDYRPRTEEDFSRIEYWVDAQTRESHWITVNSANITYIFGKTTDARVSDPEDPTRVFQWLLEETFDAHGNFILYQYRADDRSHTPPAIYETNRKAVSRYLHRIQYGNITPYRQEEEPPQRWYFEVVFDYGEYTFSDSDPSLYTVADTLPSSLHRLDPFSSYHAGFEIRTYRICRNILMFHHFKDELGIEDVLVHITRIHYMESPVATLLSAIESIGCRYENGAYQTQSLPPLELNYTEFAPASQKFEQLADIYGHPLAASPVGFQVVDLFGEGIPGVLYEDNKTLLYSEASIDYGQANAGLSYKVPELAPALPVALSSNDGEHLTWLADLTGDGLLDLIVSNGTQFGYYEGTPAHTWQPFQFFPRFPTSFHAPLQYLVDTNGNGLADLVLIEQGSITIYPSMGKAGFDSPIVQPLNIPLPFGVASDASAALRFADMFGTGTQHLVRVSNGLVECWPNLSYGRFGDPIILGNAPRFEGEFDASRLFFADLDGCGTADLIYAYSDHVSIFFNQSGNSFSDALDIYLPGQWDQFDQLEIIDICGNGTAALVFSENHPEPKLWCYDFSHRQKPYLLKEIHNNFGATTVIHYCSSTKFYLQDKQNQQPWQTCPPFPIQVIEKIEHIDHLLQSKLVNTYSYHHGYYDRDEREFRGFGRVEHCDAEFELGDTPGLYAPVTLTKTWYHTGAYLDEKAFSARYRTEYFHGDGEAYILPEHRFNYQDYQRQQPGYAPTGDDWREAYRALRGHVLRQEVYAPSAKPDLPSQKQDAPYTVSETAYAMALLQPCTANSYGRIWVYPQEQINYVYERDPLDPRIEHDIILEVDAYGQVLRSAKIHYGRRKGPDTLTDQAQTKIALEENVFFNQSDDTTHLLGTPLEQKIFELKKFTPPEGKIYLSSTDFSSLPKTWTGTPDMPLLMAERYYYWGTDAPAPLGQVPPQALLSFVETTAFNIQQLREQFDGILGFDGLHDLLQTQGGYKLEGDTWWSRGPTESYNGAEQFFLPRASTDPFGHATTYRYDPYGLLLIEITDALGNQSTITRADYHSLYPLQIRDINNNIHEVAINALGLATVNSHYGSENGVNTGFAPLSGYRQQPEAENWTPILQAPQAYLQGADSVFYYDLFAWMGQLHSEDLDGIGTDRQALWDALVAQGYLTSHGAILQVGWDALEQGRLQLDTRFAPFIEAIGKVLAAIPHRQPVCTLTLEASYYPVKGSAGITRDRLTGLAPQINDLWQELVGQGYIDPDGVILQPFWDAPGAEALQLSTTFQAQAAAIYNLLLSTINVSVAYDDGFDRIIQQKMRVEGGDAYALDDLARLTPTSPKPVTHPVGRRWLTSGAKRYDNKGNQVQEYEPYFTDSPAFFDAPALRAFQASSTLFYDAVGRVIGVETAQGFVMKDAWTAWKLTYWDVIDTLRDSPYYQANIRQPQPGAPYFDPTLADDGREVIARTESLYDTPKQRLLDNTGNTLQVGYQRADKTYQTSFYQWDLPGNLVAAADSRLAAQGRTNFRYIYNLLGQAMGIQSADSGSTLWTFLNVMGLPIYVQDANQTQFWMTYDALNRIRTLDVQTQGEPVKRREFIVYGEDLGPAQAAAQNLRGRVYQHYDQSGLTQIEGYSLLGEPLAITRRLTKNYDGGVEWADVSLQGQAEKLQAAVYPFHYQYDAFQRLLAYGDSFDQQLLYQYYPSGSLSGIFMRGKAGDAPQLLYQVEAYNAFGQPLRVHYGHQTALQTAYTYDPKTFRTLRILTTQASGKTWQDLTYTYDPLGNVSRVTDRASGQLLTGNAGEWVSDYLYDALYQLDKASYGSPSAEKTLSLPVSQPAQRYKASFQYDNAGNLTKMIRTSENGQMLVTRMTVSERSNRAVSASLTSDPARVEDFFDANGNPVRSETLSSMSWNYHDQLVKTTLHDDRASEYYVYNHAGERIRKVTQYHDAAGQITAFDEAVYLGEMEIHTHYEGATLEPAHQVYQYTTLHVLHNLYAIASCLQTRSGSAPLPGAVQIRYTLEDRLGSCTIEVDQDGQLLSYEAYEPYGATALLAARDVHDALKLYRYSGKERDALTQLYYYGARYYAPETGRWLSPDPGGTIDGLNLYAFVNNNPLTKIDPMGFCSADELQLQRDVRYMTANEFEEALKIANAVYLEAYQNQTLFTDESAQFSAGLEAKILGVFSKFAGAFSVINKTLWKAIKGAGGLEDMASGDARKAYKDLRQKANKTLQTHFPNLKFAKFELHHVHYKKLQPRLAITIGNFAMTTRGSSQSGLIGTHEGLFHLISSGNDRTIYKKEIAAVMGLFKRAFYKAIGASLAGKLKWLRFSKGGNYTVSTEKPIQGARESARLQLKNARKREATTGIPKFLEFKNPAAMKQQPKVKRIKLST